MIDLSQDYLNKKYLRQVEVMGGFKDWEFVVRPFKLIKQYILLVYKSVHLFYTLEHLS